MSPQDALQLLDSLVGQIAMPREGHVRARHAIEVLKTALAAQIGTEPGTGEQAHG